MATLITCLSCDDCGEIVGLKTDADWQRFDETWADSLHHQFCPQCKIKISNRALMRMDLKFMESLAASTDDKEFPEFIN